MKGFAVTGWKNSGKLFEPHERIAAIDVGTNSVRLVVAEAIAGGDYRMIDDEKEATRLGSGLEETKVLNPAGVEKTLAALTRMKEIAAGFEAKRVRAIGTCAIREAKDGPAFVQMTREKCGVEIETIDSDEEARLAHLSVDRNFDLSDKQSVIVDMGGGSAEIILVCDKIIEAIFPTPLGAVRMSEKFGGDSALDAGGFRRLKKKISKRLDRCVEDVRFAAHSIIGSGGTFTTLAAMMMARRDESTAHAAGYRIRHVDLVQLNDELRKMSPKERRGVKGLGADRADIIVAALCAIDAMMRRFQTNLLEVNVGGVREGLLLSMLGGSSEPTGRDDRMSAVTSLAIRCGVDMPHSSRAAFLGGLLFDQIAAHYKLDPALRELLHAAALLQNAGYFVNYQEHHKHSYHLIRNSRLPGFKSAELRIIANVARYHRGARPKKSHAGYRELSSDDRRSVRRLAGILRLANGFDRSRTQWVTDLDVDIQTQGIVVRLIGEGASDLDIWGARRRAELFERVFRTTVSIEGPGGRVASEGK